MTSKEFIQNQIRLQKRILFENRNNFSKEMKVLYEDDLKHYNQVLNNLEILDILKKSMKETGIKTSDDKVVLKWELFDIKEQKTFNLFNITINNEEDFNKVMEWLEK